MLAKCEWVCLYERQGQLCEANLDVTELNAGADQPELYVTLAETQSASNILVAYTAQTKGDGDLLCLLLVSKRNLFLQLYSIAILTVPIMNTFAKSCD